MGCILGLLVWQLLCSPAFAQGEQAVDSEQDGASKGRQWVTGRVASLSRQTGSFDEKPLAEVLQALGREPPPTGAKVRLQAVPSRYKRLRGLLDGTSGVSSAEGLAVNLEGGGRFSVRTPAGGAWKVVVTAPGFVPMEAYLPRFPVELELGTVWLLPAQTETVSLGENGVLHGPLGARPLGARHLGSRPVRLRTAVPGPAGSIREAAGESWVASMWSESPGLDAQRRFGAWRRSPIRLWARGSFDVLRGLDEVLGLLVTHDGNHEASREGVFLVPRDHQGGELEDFVLEQRGSVVSSLVKIAHGGTPGGDGEQAEESVPVAASLPAEGVLLTVDGRPVGQSDERGLISAEVREGAQLAAVAEDGRWARLVAVKGPKTIDDDESGGEPILLALVEGQRVHISVRDARSGALIVGAAPNTWNSGFNSTHDAGDEDRRRTNDGTISMVLGVEDLASRNLESGGGGVDSRGDRQTAREDQQQTSAINFAVDVGAVGYLGAQALLSGSADGTFVLETEVALLRQAMAEGRVGTRSGTPLADVDILAVPQNGSVKPSWAHSDANGLFRLRQLAPDTRYGLFAMHREYPVGVAAFTAPKPGQRRQDLSVALYKPLRVTGWVLDDADGLPISGGLVRMRWEKGLRNGRSRFARQMERPAVIEAVTDDDGQFAFADVSPGYYGVEVVASGWATTFVPSREVSEKVSQTMDLHEAVEVGTFFLVPESVISVQVVDADQNAVVPATVWWGVGQNPNTSTGWFASRNPRSGSTREPPWASGSVDDSGFIRLSGIESESSVSLLVEAPGFVSRRVDELVVDWEGVQGGSAEAVIVPLVPAASVAGFVADSDGRRLANAHVSILSPSQGMDFPRNLYQRTNADGRFHFDGLPPGEVLITANPLDVAMIEPLRFDLEVGEERTDVALVAPPSAAVEGTVSNAHGPMSDVSVVCDGQFATTDANGYFLVDHVRLGSQQIEVRVVRGKPEVRVIVVERSGNWVEFHLLGNGSTANRVRGSLSIAGHVLTDEGSPSPVVRVNGPGGAHRVVLVDRTFRVEGLAPGNYGIQAYGELPQYDYETVSLVDQDVEGIVLDVRTPPEGAVRVTIQGLEPRDEESLMRFGLPVRLTRRDENKAAGLGSRIFANPETHSIPWRDGAFVVEQLPVGSWLIEATVGDGLYRASEQFSIGDGQDTNVALYFERTDLEKLLGQLTVNGLASAGWIAGRPVRGLETFGASVEDLYDGSKTARANALGQFEIALPPGDIQLLVSVANTAAGSFRLYAQAGVPLRLDLTRVQVSGRVLLADDEPAAGLRVTAARPGFQDNFTARSLTQSDGTFSIDTLTLGEHLVLRVTGQGDEIVLWETGVSGSSGEQGITVRLPPQ